MYVDMTKSPPEGTEPPSYNNAVPQSENGVPNAVSPCAEDAAKNSTARLITDSATTLTPAADSSSAPQSKITPAESTGSLHAHQYHPNHHHHHPTNATNGITPSRSFANRKKLICRCPRGILCVRDIQQARGNHRTINSGHDATQLNIPIEKDTAKMVPDPASVSGAQPPTWVSHVNNSHATTNFQGKRVLVVRGMQNPPLPYDTNQLLRSQQQIQQNIKTIQIHNTYRSRAIDYMMTHLQFRGCENEKGLDAVRKRIEKLEEQAFSSAKDKDQYVQLLAVKLGAIMESLYSCHNNKMNLSKPPSTTATHPQPTCG